MDIYINALSEESSTFDQRDSNARVLYSIVVETIVPRLQHGIDEYGIPIAGTYDKSPYMTMGTGRLYIAAYEDLVKVENFLLITLTQLKLAGLIDYFEVYKVMDGFFIDFIWNLV